MRRRLHKWLGLAPAALVIAAVMVATAGAQNGRAGGATRHAPKSHHAARTLAVTAPDHVTQTVQGCRNDGSITFPSGGPFVCPDAAYTGGNLGKGWNELDLVPFRLTTATGQSSPATQTFDTGVAFDASDGGHPGYDVISALTLNTTLSDASCVLVSQSAQTDIVPGFGGIDKSIGRTVEITQLKNTTCVFDYYGRLALGSHLFPGSSLHGNLSDGSLSSTNQDVPIPVKEILPQSITKTMAASRNTDHIWSVSKDATPTVVHFGNMCSNTYSSTQPLSIKVSWTKSAASPSGDVTIVTKIYASNPAARTITTTATDKIYEGSTQTTQVGSTVVGSGVDVPANTSDFLILTDTQTVSSSATSFNDVATATYIDKDTGIAVPGTTEATASATVQTGTEFNSTASVQDSESITGSGLTFAVATPASGSFSGYTAGTYVTGPVVWNSDTLSDSGDVTFSKTIKIDPKQVTSGAISDTATLTGSDGASASGSASVNIDSTAAATLTIDKTIPNILTGNETASFTFHVFDSANDEVGTGYTLNFAAGDTHKTVSISNLAPDTYTVKEATATGWSAQADQSVNLTGTTCSGTANFVNTFTAATAHASKVTDPTGYQQGWTLTLTRPDNTTLPLQTDANGNVNFGNLGAEGSYTITETGQTGWSEVSAVGGTGVTGGTGAGASCSFTVNYPANAGQDYTCTFHNKSRGKVRVVKQINGAPITGSQTFQFELRQGDQHTTSTSPLETLIANSTNGGTLNYTTALVPGTTYAICELLVASYNPTISGYGPYNPLDNANYWCWNFSITVAQAASNPSIIFNVENDHPTSKALTIGYWKNWTACKNSKGKQADVLGQYLGGIKLGTYTFTNSLSDECNAVQTLSKNTFSGQNRSSDPLFNMAAQLLAADLNINAQAGVCSSLITAVNGGQALLVKYSWNGNTYSPALTAADAILANSYAQTLDKYNNNQLC